VNSGRSLSSLKPNTKHAQESFGQFRDEITPDDQDGRS
jgi:hypothetical protein